MFLSLFPSSLTQTATIQRRTGTKDSHGSVKDIWEDVATAVPCRVSARGLSPTFVNSERDTQSIIFTPTVYMNYRTDVKQDDRLVIKNAANEDEYYLVLLASNPGNTNHHLTITTRLIRG